MTMKKIVVEYLMKRVSMLITMNCYFSVVVVNFLLVKVEEKYLLLIVLLFVVEVEKVKQCLFDYWQ